MDAFADFSVDKTTFPDLPTWTAALHAQNRKLTVIIDAGLSAESPENQYYVTAAQNKALLKSAIFPDVNQGWLTQKLWPGKAVYLDFFNETAVDVWKSGLNDLWDLVPYDGIWLDINEASGDCNGECGATIPNDTLSNEGPTSKMSSWFNKFESLISTV